MLPRITSDVHIRLAAIRRKMTDRTIRPQKVHRTMTVIKFRLENYTRPTSLYCDMFKYYKLYLHCDNTKIKKQKNIILIPRTRTNLTNRRRSLDK